MDVGSIIMNRDDCAHRRMTEAEVRQGLHDVQLKATIMSNAVAGGLILGMSMVAAPPVRGMLFLVSATLCGSAAALKFL
jgi:hypothetical protein